MPTRLRCGTPRVLAFLEFVFAMTPRDYLRMYRRDDRLTTGGFYPDAPLEVNAGETVAVVMLNHGGPNALEDVEPFLYNLFMDPAVVDLPLGRFLRHWMARGLARMRAPSVAEDYERIGGSSPINRLTQEQATGLERHLNATYGRPAGVTFRTYMAMRYWHPFSEEAAAQMEEDGVDRVVLLPLYPHWSATTSGASIAYWHALDETGEIPSWPTTSVFEYAAHPKYVQAISERIDEALQRFPASVRNDVHLLFSALGTPRNERTVHGDPYCCHLHSTVTDVVQRRDGDPSYTVSFQGQDGFAEWLSPSTTRALRDLAEQDVDGVLVVPISYLADHVETHYDLDIEVRQAAETAGIRHFEVASGLNAHPLLIEALAEASLEQLRLPAASDATPADPTPGADDEAGQERNRPTRPPRSGSDTPRYELTQQSMRCPQCERETGARRWTMRHDGSTSTTDAAQTDSQQTDPQQTDSQQTDPQQTDPQQTDP